MNDPGNADPAEEKSPTPRPVLFQTLALLWVFPSLGAAVILGSSGEGRPGRGATGFFAGIALEQWVAVLILICHGWLVWRWWRTRGR